MKKLTVIRGPLGVGKTIISKLLSKQLGLGYLSLDQIVDDNNLVPPEADGVPLESYLKANEIILKEASKRDKSFVIDGCFYYQDQLDDLFKKFSQDVQVFTIMSSVETCIKRDSERGKSYGEDSARFVHMITSQIEIGTIVDNTNLSIEETGEMIKIDLLQSDFINAIKFSSYP